MRKIVVQDFYASFIWFLVFFLLLNTLFIDFPADSYTRYWYWKALVFGIYAIFLFFSFLKEQIRYITLSDNKIIIRYNKLLKSHSLEINKNDVKCCTMYVYRNNIKLTFALIDDNTLVVNHCFVTPILIEKISAISNLVDKFTYIICKADYPNRADTFEKIINNDKKVILIQKVYATLIICSIAFITVIVVMCTIFK